MALLLAIDIGTSSAKSLLFETDTASVLASASQEYPLHQPAPGHAEQDPDDWWRAAVHSAREAMAAANRRDVSAIGLTGQMHGGVLLDESARPVAPAIIWADSRSAAECQSLVRAVGDERYVRLTGTLPAPGFLVATLLWLKDNRRDLLDRASQVVLPKDYVRLMLTGEIATDVSDAASTGVFDISAQEWADDILEAVRLPRGLFPRVHHSAAIAGTLTPQAASALGLRPGTPVVAGCADQPAQALANGLIRPGAASVTTGTGGQVFVPVAARERGARVPTDPRVHVFNHAAPDMLYVLGAILSAGLSLRWLRNTLGLPSTPDAYALLSAEAARVPPGADGLLFMPYLIGERTPYMDAYARGGFIGLGYQHTRGHLARAVMEGVAFALRQALEISLDLSVEPVTRVIASGGGAESPVWRQIQADVFGLPLSKTLLAEQTGIGAALLAGTGAGIYADLAEASAATARFGDPVEPDDARYARYNALYEQFCDLYPRLKRDFHRLARPE
jgi:xylulokinase